MHLRTLIICFFGVFILNCCQVQAQCTATISTFPYQESFETGTSNWVTAGINNDWAWGTPSKPTINSAGAGTKCWITGGLTASFYSLGERSWVESPCFDFTNLDRPYVSFLIFWELERVYDGGNLQYTTDGGSTWKIVGGYNDPVQCNTSNWYNTSNIVNLSFLNNTQGWSGTIQPSGSGCNGGGGSAQWKLATHCMGNLAHLPQVKFRFTFGSGTTCNDYDGLAFDDFYIGSAPPIQNDFVFTCVDGNTLHFNDVTTTCFNQWSWDFGEPSSTSNTALTSAANHQYAFGGLYTVSLTTSGLCTFDTVITKQVKILDVQKQITSVSCVGVNDGIATVKVINAGPGVSYSWSHDGSLSTPVAAGLSPGNYSVLVSDPGACSVTAVFNIGYGQDASPEISLGRDTFFCPPSVLILRPGKYSTYRWQDNSTDSVFPVTQEGNYFVRVTNASGCPAVDSILVGLDCINDIIIPNSFTPNGDGRNDVFEINGSVTFDFELRIFNRWGEVVFLSDNKNQGWDGSLKGNPVQEGFYNYLVNYSIGKEEKIKKGSIYLYR